MPERNLLIVPAPGETSQWTTESGATAGFPLPEPWNATRTLTDIVTGAVFNAEADGLFKGLTTGIYRME
jgi:hypothetical protein